MAYREYSINKITPDDTTKFLSMDGENSGYQTNEDLKNFILDSNLYIGDTEPTDDVKMWVDTSDEEEITMPSVPVGTILPYTGNGTPYGYLLCDGHSESKTTYPALFAVIGYTYGGNEDNFNLPDLRGRFLEGSVEAGSYKEAGLPNITGVVSVQSGNSEPKFREPSGAFAEIGHVSYYGKTTDTTVGGGRSDGVDFDASRSSSVYKNDVDTVQPASLTVRYIIKAYDSVTTKTEVVEIENQISNIESKIKNVSNRNLLDNPWFTVNQRGETSGSAYAYFLDRWMFDFQSGTSSSWSYANGVLTINANGRLMQKTESELYQSIVGNIVTMSVMFADGTVKYGSCMVENGVSAEALDDEDIRLRISETGVFRVYNNRTTPLQVKAFKLELGTKSTLAYDSAPDYQTELLKCQRYFWRLKSGDIGLFISHSNISSSHKIYGVIYMPTEMREIPSLTNSDSIFAMTGTKTGFTLASPTITTTGNTQRVEVAIVSSDLSDIGIYLVWKNAGYWDFSADL